MWMPHTSGRLFQRTGGAAAKAQLPMVEHGLWWPTNAVSRRQRRKGDQPTSVCRAMEAGVHNHS